MTYKFARRITDIPCLANHTRLTISSSFGELQGSMAELDHLNRMLQQTVHADSLLNLYVEVPKAGRTESLLRVYQKISRWLQARILLVHRCSPSMGPQKSYARQDIEICSMLDKRPNSV